MQIRLYIILVSFFALCIFGCSAKVRVWDNPVDPSVTSEVKKGAAPTPETLQLLSFTKFDLPITSKDFEIKESAGSIDAAVFAVKSAFEQSVTFFSIERSKNLADYYWRLNARKYKFTNDGFELWPGLANPVNLFPECNDPIQGNGVASASIVSISDKFRTPGFGMDSLPDNITHVGLRIECRSQSLGLSAVTFLKVLNVNNLSEDNSVKLTPLADSKKGVCVWPSKQLIISESGQMFSFRLWTGAAIPGNFSSVGSLALGEIKDCFEKDGQFHVKTLSNRCFNFNIESNSLMISDCFDGNSVRSIQPFSVSHSPYKSESCFSSGDYPKRIYEIGTGSDVHIIALPKCDTANARPWFSLNGNSRDFSEPQASEKWLSITANSVSVEVGREQQFGQRIFGWSKDKKALFLSTPIISGSAMEEVRYSKLEMNPEPAVPFSFKENIFTSARGGGFSIFPSWNIFLIANHVPSQFKVYEAGQEATAAWQPYTANVSYSFASGSHSGTLMLRMTDEKNALSEEFELGRRVAEPFWSQEAYVKASNANAYDFFGYSIALSGDTLAVGAQRESSSQTTITNGTGASGDNSARFAGAVYVYRDLGGLFDPHVRVSVRTSDSISLSWHANLGTTTTVRLASASSASASPALCSDAAAITLPAGATSYTYSGLAANSKYGFRVCSFDGTNVSAGALIWEDTRP